jgi:hypothetical protein
MANSDQCPTREQINALDRELLVSPQTVHGNEISAVVDWLRDDRPNGGAHLASFRFDPHPVFDWFTTRGRLPELNCMLDHPRLRRALPAAFQQPPPHPERLERYLKGWELGTSIQLGRQWAWLLYAGGMYTSPNLAPSTSQQDQRAKRAIAAGEGLYAALFEDRYSTVDVYLTPDPWCGWFPGLFNTTWVVYDRQRRTMLLLCVTDMD